MGRNRLLNCALKYARTSCGRARSVALRARSTAASSCSAVNMAGCRAEVVDLDGEPGYVAEGDTAVEEPVDPWVALLPGLDPTTMGWKQRAWYLDPACADAFDRAGNGGPTIWVDGRIVGAWAQDADGGIRTHYFLDVPARVRRRVDAEAGRLRALVGDDPLLGALPEPGPQGAARRRRRPVRRVTARPATDSGRKPRGGPGVARA